jgi:hypothetical protein
MLQAMTQALIHTPWWVFVLFFYLLVRGYKASQTRVVALKKLFILPIILILLSLHSLLVNIPLSVFNVMVWAFALLAGVLLGCYQMLNQRLSFDKTKQWVKLPGSWFTFILILIIFASKYYFGYEMAANPHILTNFKFAITMLVVLGVCSGLFVGRLVFYVYRYRHSAHTDLSTAK